MLLGALDRDASPDSVDWILHDLYDYWRLKAGDQPAPSRRDLDPVEISKLLPHVGLADVMADEEHHFRIRLIGTKLGRLLTGPRTGVALSRRSPDPLCTFLTDLCARAAYRLAPVRLDSRTHFRGLRTADIRWIALPLSASGDSADMVLFSGVPINEEAFEALDDAVPQVVETLEAGGLESGVLRQSREAAV